jgi:four helix bundle protein
MDRPIASAEQLAWEQVCSAAITSDVIWKLDAYRAALFLLHVSRADCRAIRAVRTEEFLEHQLSSAAGSVSAHVSEGYSRATRADRKRFYGYALSSVRECVTWYLTGIDILSADVVETRLTLLARLRALLLGLIRALRDNEGGHSRFEP